MTQFNIGDKVRYIGHNFSFYNLTGIIVDIDPRADIYVVEHPDLPVYRRRYWKASEIQLVPKPVPSTSLLGVLSDSNNIANITDLLKYDALSCDCGGFKTYSSMEAGFHSSWCSSLNATKN